MAGGWVKSWQCKSRALDDVVSNHHHHHHQYHLLPNSANCKNGVKNLKDVVETTKNRGPRRQKSHRPPEKSPSRPPELKNRDVAPAGGSTRLSRAARASVESSLLPALMELPEGHPSRNVVEIIFQSSWVSIAGSTKAFSGRVEVVFKVQNLARTVTRFDEYRELVKSRAGNVKDGEDHARCVADGNEVMRFYCLGPTTGGGTYDNGGSAWAFNGCKGAAVCTYSGSGAAHDSAGGGRGRRAMLVCRVIAGRVCMQLGFDSLLEGRVGYDSVSGENGELLVFDSRAVLPCFLIIYKL